MTSSAVVGSTLTPTVLTTVAASVAALNETALIANVTERSLDCSTCLPYTTTLIFSIVFSMIIIVGVLGNVFVVFVIIGDKKLLHSSVNQFLLNLALADLGNLVFCSPDAFMVLVDRGWVLPHWACPVLRFLQEFFLYASVLLQMAIGIERYLAICSPLKMQRFTSRTTIIVVGSMWCTAVLFALPYFIFQGIIRVQFKGVGKGFDFCFWTKLLPSKARTYFKDAEFFVLYAAPLVLLTVLYAVMGRVLWGHSANIANETQQIAILKLRRSVVKMLIISMFLYFLCYTPIQGLFLMELIFKRHVNLSTWLRLVMNVLSVMSSMANPIVYIMCCRHFHTRFVSLCAKFAQICTNCTRPTKELFIDGDTTLTRLSRSPYVSFRRSRKKTRDALSTLL